MANIFLRHATTHFFSIKNIYEHPRPPGEGGGKVFVVNLLYDIISRMDTTRFQRNGFFAGSNWVAFFVKAYAIIQSMVFVLDSFVCNTFA